MTHRLLAALLVVAAGLLAPPPAEAEVIERVVAVVNDEAIFLSELRRRATPLLAQIPENASVAERLAYVQRVYEQMLENMVNAELIRQAGDDMQVRVTSAEVDRAIRNVQEQIPGLRSEEEFWQAVRAQGWNDPADYRRDIEEQLFRMKVLNERVRSRVNITEEQVRERYDMQVTQARRTSRFRAAQIFQPFPAEGGATARRDLRRELEALRERITSPEDFEAAMAEVGGRELGWLQEGQLVESLESALLVLAPGEVSPVVRGPSGFHIMLVRERELAAADVPPYEQVRMQIFREMQESAMMRQERQFLTELRRDAQIEIRLNEED